MMHPSQHFLVNLSSHLSASLLLHFLKHLLTLETTGTPRSLAQQGPAQKQYYQSYSLQVFN
jgi:hypothetical protein